MGSPRKGGNTDILIDKVINGAQAAGHLSEKLYLYDLTLLPCIDCRNCSSGDRVCNRDDDMQDIYPRIEAADVILFGTPLYPKFDRFHSFLKKRSPPFTLKFPIFIRKNHLTVHKNLTGNLRNTLYLPQNQRIY